MYNPCKGMYMPGASRKSTRDPYHLLLSKKERAQYQRAADADRRPLSDWIRLTCDKASLATLKDKKES